MLNGGSPGASQAGIKKKIHKESQIFKFHDTTSAAFFLQIKLSPLFLSTLSDLLSFVKYS